MKENLKLAEKWIGIGDEDLSSAKILIENKGSFRNIGFHCQQASEKYLKAFLIFLGVKFPKSHDLTQLYNLCIQSDSSLELDLDYLINLTEYAVEIRYSIDAKIDEEHLYSGYNYVTYIKEQILKKIYESQN